MAGRPFQRIAIVNRGEPAMRLVNAVREYDAESDVRLRTIALYTEPDRQAMFVRQADEAYDLGAATYADDGGGRRVSYLDHGRLAEALMATEADAAWVGWGFVSEQPAFVDLCDELGVVFIGPGAETMRRLGDKIESKRLAESADVPVAAWSDGPVSTAEEARVAADRIGYPVMIKATAGGGGRGIRRVESVDDIEAAFASAQAEAGAAFGDETLFVEALVLGARHIEVQIIADLHGTVWSVGVRDCSVQRRNQKLLEEAPSPALTERQDAEVRAAAARLGQAAGYSSAGTVEFLFDPGSGRFQFMEVNARLQVEHPITEVTTGLDLVKLQLHVARGGTLDGGPPPTVGAAIEARLNAEDPQRDFAPAPGRIDRLQLPTGPGLRVDTGVEEGDVVAAEYDSMIAKIIAHGRDRSEALARLRRALDQTTVLVRDGITNKAFLRELLEEPEFIAGTVDVGWLDRSPELVGRLGPEHAAVALVGAAIAAYEEEAAVEIRQFRSSAARGRPEIDDHLGRTVELRRQGEGYRFDVFQTGADRFRVEIDGHQVHVERQQLGPRAGARLSFGDRTHQVLSVVQGITHLVEVDGHTHRVMHDEGGVIRAPSPAVVVAVPVSAGEDIEPGDRLAVIEAMKMETAIVAEFPGRVREVLVRDNSQVAAGAPLLVLEPTERDDGSGDGDRADFAPLATVDDVAHDRCRHYLDDLRRLLLGFDVEVDDLEAVTDGIEQLCGDPLDGHEQVRMEEDILSIFVDVISLFRRNPVDEELGAIARRASEEYLFSYLRRLETAGEGLPEPFVDQLRRTLAHFGVTSLTPTPELETALFRITRSHQRMDRQIGPVLQVLENRLDHPTPGADPALARLLDRVARETRHRFAAVHDLTAELSYRNFDEPFLGEVRAAALEGAELHLAALEADPDGPERAAHVEALVACTQPLKTLISQRFAGSEPGVRGALLEVMTRRYYRIRDLEDMTTGEAGGFSYASARYPRDETPIDVFSTHLDYDNLAAGARALRPLFAAVDPDHDVVVDFYVWRQTPIDDFEATREHVRAVLADQLGSLGLRRVVVAISTPQSGEAMAGVTHITLRPDDEGGYRIEEQRHGLHPMMAKRLQLWRLDAFDIEELPTQPDIYLFHGRATENPRDERLFALAEVRDLTAVRDDAGHVQRLPEFERVLREVLGAIRRFQARRPDGRRLQWNRIFLYVWPPIDLTVEDMNRLAERITPDTADLGIEKTLIMGTVRDRDGDVHPQVFEVGDPSGADLGIRIRDRADEPLRPLDDYTRKEVALRRRGLVYPYDLVRVLAPPAAGADGDRSPSGFTEHDLEGDRLVPVDRPPGENTANVVAGVITNVTTTHPEGMRRVILLGDPTRGMGNLAEPECRRIIAAMDLADELGLPLEWFAVSAGALISMDSGTENMDWIARVLRRIIEFTQDGGEINVVVPGINVGAQPYWNAEATMLMHTRGILVMTPEGAMVLTGKEALDYSGGASAEDNQGIGGYERIMGPNGQAQYLARDLSHACAILLRHYDHTYVAPGERFPRRAETADPVDRDVCLAPHGGDFATIGDVFSIEENPDRKRPFEIRRLMGATVDQDHPTMERWYGVENAEVAVVWDAHLGGWPVCLLGMESKNLPRVGFVPADGPEQWTAGTLFPMGSKKVARAINAASGNRPLVVLANLSGFDGSPESLRALQLEYGAEIGRAVVNFDGPIVFCVVSRYHGGAFVVFSGTLNDNMEVAAVAGSRASVIGGAPAAGVVCAREVRRRTAEDPELVDLERRIDGAEGAVRAELRAELTRRRDEVHARELGEVADEFDGVHSVERAQEVGSLDRIIDPSELRPYLIDAVERGIARELDRRG
jgi:acetyl/propionyl-CoA carboxylase alpha subunit/acetyl-CoA carboxylase carboxyltransferase component